MGVSFKELRRVCQEPVADGNDVAGLLFGDKASLPFTKLLVDTGLSPSVATVGMLVTGLVGSALQFGGPGVVVAGAMFLLLYYVLDCVDGEVARWRKIEHARWGYYEYIFHFIVKPVAFLSIGFATWLETGHIELVIAGVAAATATLWLKLFLGLPSIVFVGSVFGRRFSGDRPYSEYLREAEERLAKEAAASGGGGRGEVFRLRLDLVTLRSLGTNFDVGLLLLVLVSAADMVIGDLPWFWGASGGPGDGAAAGSGAMSLRGLWVLYYGVVLPLDFLDYVRTYFKQGHFDRQMVRLLVGAHGFALPRHAREAGEERDAAPPSAGPRRVTGSEPGTAAR